MYISVKPQWLKLAGTRALDCPADLINRENSGLDKHAPPRSGYGRREGRRAGGRFVICRYVTSRRSLLTYIHMHIST